MRSPPCMISKHAHIGVGEIKIAAATDSYVARLSFFNIFLTVVCLVPQANPSCAPRLHVRPSVDTAMRYLATRSSRSTTPQQQRYVPRMCTAMSSSRAWYASPRAYGGWVSTAPGARAAAQRVGVCVGLNIGGAAPFLPTEGGRSRSHQIAGSAPKHGIMCEV